MSVTVDAGYGYATASANYGRAAVDAFISYAVAVESQPAVRGGFLYDEDSGAFLYDDATGAMITA